MFEHFAWASFLLAITLLTVSPGADTLLVLRRTTLGGWRAGVVASFGICCGLFVHALLSALGVALLIKSSEVAFLALKFAGSLYLILLGLQALIAALRQRSLQLGNLQAKNLVQSFQQGFLNNLLNPKTLVFYLAFLPQFVNPAFSALLQSLMMAGLHFLIAMLWQSALAIAVNQVRKWLIRPLTLRIIDGLTGVMFLLLGLSLALTKI